MVNRNVRTEIYIQVRFRFHSIHKAIRRTMNEKSRMKHKMTTTTVELPRQFYMQFLRTQLWAQRNTTNTRQ